MMATLALAKTVQDLMKDGVLVRKLESVEALAHIDSLVVDKTGCLTQNMMEVDCCYYDGKQRGAHEPSSSQDPTFKFLQNAAILGNHAQIGEKCSGSASDIALLKWASSSVSIDDVKAKYPVGKTSKGEPTEIPFTSMIKYAGVVVHQPTEGSEWSFYVKGASEKILQMSSHIMDKGVPVKLTDEHRKAVVHELEALGSRGRRTLGFAIQHLPGHTFGKNHEFPPRQEAAEQQSFGIAQNEMTFIGLLAICDPLRKGATQAIQTCQKLGIKVIMITGDAATVSETVAREAGLIVGETSKQIEASTHCSHEEAIKKAQSIVIEGSEINSLVEKGEAGKKEMLEILKKPYVVFARCTPSHKLEIVKDLKSLGYKVGAVGDGTNDVPAMSASSVSFCLGIAGTEVAKEASDMILIDDNINSIAHAIVHSKKLLPKENPHH